MTDRSTDDFIAARADALSGGVASQRLAWEQALRRLVSLDLPGDDRDGLLEAVPDAGQLGRLAAWLGLRGASDAPAQMGALRDRVGESGFELDDWLAALDCLHRWQSERAALPPLEHALGYVHCCAEALRLDTAPPGASLPAAVHEMLRDYGWEAEG